jgi:MSHA biogenesis protein MshP
MTLTRLRQRGFSLITAIFLIVVLAALGAYMVIFTGLQQATLQADVLGVRAYYAARAGAEWAIYRALDPDNTIVIPASATTFAPCPSGTINTLGGSLSPFTVVISCTELPVPATEAGRSIQVYSITATACNNTTCPVLPLDVPPSGYVERQIAVTVARCKDPGAATPRFECGL